MESTEITPTVNYDLAFRFREMVEELTDCKVNKVVELKTCELLMYVIECPKDREELIFDMAFMTFIKNPEFQKYYKDTKEFKTIAERNGYLL